MDVQQTKANGDLVGSTTYARTGEYDALGRNVADAGRFITLNSEPPPDTYGSGIDLFGSEEGYRPGQNTYRIDGLPISQSQFMQVINSGQIGGAFGVLFAMARLSARPPRLQSLQVGNRYFAPTERGANQAITQAIESNTFSITRNWAVDNSWSVSLSLITQDDKELWASTASDRKKISLFDRTYLKKKISAILTKDCTDFINKLVVKAHEITDNDWNKAGRTGPIEQSKSNLYEMV